MLTEREEKLTHPQYHTAALREALAYLDTLAKFGGTLDAARALAEKGAHAARALSAAHPHPAGWRDIAPDGWKLVPIEPTETMVVCGFESRPDPIFSKPEEWEAFDAMSGCQQAAHKARLCWAAMLDASPAHPAEQQEGDAAGEKDAALLQAMAAEWDRARRGVDSRMPIWDALCEAVGENADGAGMRAAISAAMQAMKG